MATIKQATSAILDGVVTTTTATAIVTKEVAGGLVDLTREVRKGTKTVGKAVDMVDNTFEYANEILEREVEELKLKNEVEMQYLREIYEDDAFKAKVRKQMEKNLLADYEEAEAITL